MSDEKRHVTDEEVQSEITAFCQSMTEQQIDAEDGYADLWDMYVDDSGDSEQLKMIFERKSGKRFTKSLIQPDPGEPTAALNMLIRYWRVNRDEPSTWIGNSVPIEYDRHTDDWEINWQIVESDLAGRSTEKVPEALDE